MRRIIHPVGQGAFYSERFVDKDGVKALVVYDCGTTKKTEKERLKKKSIGFQKVKTLTFFSYLTLTMITFVASKN